MIEWRKTAGGVEVADHLDMTAIAYTREARVEVFKAGRKIDGHSGVAYDAAKQWFEREFCRQKYTVTKYPDGGEVYVSEDGQRVAMVTMSNSMYWTERGDGAGEFQDDCESAVKAAIDYVSKETA